MRCFFAILLILSVVGFDRAAHAAEKSGGVSYYGIWSSPDCGTFGEVLVFKKNYVLKSSEEDSIFSPVQCEARRKDYDVLTFAGATHPVTRTEDGLLKLGEVEGAPEDWPQGWDDLPLIGQTEYAHCSATPPLVHAPLARVMEKIEDIRTACSADLTSACRALLFGAADADGDKKLSLQEFKKAGAMLGAFLPLLTGTPVTTANLRAGYAQGENDGERIGQKLITENGGKDLDAATAARLLPALDDSAWTLAQKNLGALFPSLAPPGGTIEADDPPAPPPEPAAAAPPAEDVIDSEEPPAEKPNEAAAEIKVEKAPDGGIGDKFINNLGGMGRSIKPLLDGIKADPTYRQNQ